MAVRAAAVEPSPKFSAQVEALKSSFPEIDDAITDFSDLLRLATRIPHMHADPQSKQPIYAARMDYPPLEAKGRGVFLVTYHATPPTGILSPTTPPRVFTLLTIAVRRRPR